MHPVPAGGASLEGSGGLQTSVPVLVPRGNCQWVADTREGAMLPFGCDANNALNNKEEAAEITKGALFTTSMVANAARLVSNVV